MKRFAGALVLLGFVALGWWWLRPSDDDASSGARVPPQSRSAEGVVHHDPRAEDGPGDPSVVPTEAPSARRAEGAETTQLPAPVARLEAEVAESPFDTETSPEIDYAYRLLHGPDAGTAAFGAAADAFERCLKQNPANVRCQLGLLAAQRAYLTGDAGLGGDAPALRLEDRRQKLLEGTRPRPLTEVPKGVPSSPKGPISKDF